MVRRGCTDANAVLDAVFCVEHAHGSAHHGHDVGQEREDDIRNGERDRVGDGGDVALRRLLRHAHPGAVASTPGNGSHEKREIHLEPAAADEPGDDRREEPHDQAADEDGRDGSLGDGLDDAGSGVDAEDRDEDVETQVFDELSSRLRVRTPKSG